MLQISKLALALIFSFVLQGCYTSTNISTTNLEVIVPGTVKFLHKFKNAAIRYNNSNISHNPRFSTYYEDNEKFIDTTNIDSFASEIYFQNFINHLKYQQYFDTVIELEKRNFIDSEYSVNDIQQIADSTGAELFLSFDFFASQDGIFSPDYKLIKSDSSNISDNDFNNFRNAIEVVHILTSWNFYDLKKKKLIYSHQKTDTIKWTEPAHNIKMAKRILPSRRDAVLNAADIAGNQFAEFLVPHWIEVERMYYKFGQGELKSANDLIKQNRWMEAAAIYRKNTKNRNKKMASKCMFNMALICELNGDMEAASDWVTKSMNANHKDPYHKGNCESYSYILRQRKLDIQKIENLE
jgi:hypothetical protein